MNKYTIDSIMQEEDVAILLPQGDEANAIIISLKQLPTYIQEGDVISAKIELGLVEKAYIEHGETKVQREKVVSLLEKLKNKNK